MAVKIFNATETEYTGTADADLIIGNNLGNFIDAGEGNNIIIGGNGADLILAGSGNDIIFGGGGADVIDAGDGNNIVYGANDTDAITSGSGNDGLFGNGGDDIIFAGDGDDFIDGGSGDDILSGEGSTAGDETVNGNVYYASSGNDAIYGGEGNDTIIIGAEIVGSLQIQAGVSGLDNAGEEAIYIDAQEDEGLGEIVVYDTINNEFVGIEDIEMAQEVETDVRLNIATRPGSTALSTFATTIDGYNAVDTISFTQSGDFSETLVFTGIERIEIASGKEITLSAEQITFNGESLDRDFINPGVHFYGVAGGPAETVNVVLEFADVEFVPAATIVGAEPVTYSKADFQLDDFSVADIFHDVEANYDASEGLAGSYTRVDGANNDESVQGSEGVDNATMRLGDDTYYGNGGNDLLIGHGGADYLDGGDGNDIFVIGGFGSGVQGTTSKADDGNAEWVAGDVIVGGLGVDTLRITTGIGAIAGNNTITLNNANFKSMEVVQVGGTVGRLNVENADLQLLNDHFYHRANSSVADLSTTLGNNGGSINNVVVDASGVTTNGLRFEGNANTNTFIGTSRADVFVGNGGNDTLTGGGGADKFVFGKVYEQIVTGAATTVQTYTNTAFNLTGVDTITDFTRTGVNRDRIELNDDQYSALTGGITNANVKANATGTATDADDYLVFNTATKMLSYDADGNGAGAAVNIAVLTGVATLNASDFIIA